MLFSKINRRIWNGSGRLLEVGAPLIGYVLLDVLPLNKMVTPNLRYGLHYQHPPVPPRLDNHRVGNRAGSVFDVDQHQKS